MLGWYFCVFRQADGGKSPAIFSSQLGSRVAEWQTDWSGTDWFEQLSASENAFSLGGDGYPLRYTVKAQILLPYLANGFPSAREALLREPGVTLTTKRIETVTIHEKVLDSCEPGEWLVVEAWDES